ncbi:MAG: DUF983 domain-containing protein [Alphaproteobacteria bacterium]|nr:DUF983 domain-containing protein [Alphaproteobacteria bacterium]
MYGDLLRLPPEDLVPAPVSAALAGRCPRCGTRGLFAGYLNIAPSCPACGLDYSQLDTGDGPAVFVILIVGAFVCGSALIVEFTLRPPYWVHAIMWLPLVLLMSFGLLRLTKSVLVGLQYRHQAREGRLGD